MGRHGGGSRSGGRSGGGSRSRGSSGGVRTSSKPFNGCYNRSYRTRSGKFRKYYTSDKNFGVVKTSKSTYVIIAFVLLHMAVMFTTLVATGYNHGEKVSGDKNRIGVVDNIGLLSYEDEQDVLDLFAEVYDTSGMPVTLYIDDFSWKNRYSSLEVYSEELYYSVGFDEDAMIILFTASEERSFFDWEYDMYCGDDTIRCLSDESFDKLLDNFQKGMATQDLTTALKYSWESVMDSLAKPSYNMVILPTALGAVLVYAILLIPLCKSIKTQREAYEYF